VTASFYFATGTRSTGKPDTAPHLAQAKPSQAKTGQANPKDLLDLRAVIQAISDEKVPASLFAQMRTTWEDGLRYVG